MYNANEERETYHGKMVEETGRAKLIDFGLEEPIWIPKSQIKEEEPSRTKDGTVGYVLPTWLAIEKGLE
jgi:hypothetical protein